MRSASGVTSYTLPKNVSRPDANASSWGPATALKTTSGENVGMKSAGSLRGFAEGLCGDAAKHVVLPQDPALDTPDLCLHTGGPAAHDDGHVEAARDGQIGTATAFCLADPDDVPCFTRMHLPASGTGS